MKILHVTDLHFHKPFFMWVSDNQNKYDCICLTGDFLDTGYHCKYTLCQQKDWISEWVKGFKTPLFICSGNHDEDDSYLDVSLESLFDLEGSEDFIHEKKQSWIAGLNNKYVTTDGMVKSFRDTIFGCSAYGETDLDRYYRCDVILTHVPPLNTLTSKSNGTDFGDSMLRDAIKNKLISPQWLLCGHIHKPKSTIDKINGITISNPGSEMKNVIPKHTVLEAN